MMSPSGSMYVRMDLKFSGYELKHCLTPAPGSTHELEELESLLVLQSSVDVIHVNFPMATSFSQGLLRSPVFSSAMVALIH